MKATLKALGKSAKKLKKRTFELDPDMPDFIFGRSREAQCMILDVNVSRQHAILKFTDQWNVVDNKSVNGVFINQRKIQPGKPHPVQHLDRLSLGPESPYEWRIEMIQPKHKPLVADTSEIELVESQYLAVNDSINADMKSKLETFKTEKEALEKRVEEEKAAQDQLKVGMDELKLELIRKQVEIETKRKSFSEDLEKRQILEQQLEKERLEMEKKHKELECEMNAKIKQSETNLQQLLQEKENSVITLQQEKTKMEENLAAERSKFEEQLNKLQNLNKENEQMSKEMLEKMKAEFDARLKANQDQFAAAVIVENQEREEERQKLNEELQQRENEIAELHVKLQNVEEGRAKEEEQKLKRDNQLKLLKLSNEELKCTICDELFVVPVTLNCGHVFCEFCINQWKDKVKKAKDFTCPNCRVEITSQTRSLQLENLISALYRDIDPAIAKEREDLIKERKAEMENAKKGNKKSKTKKPINTGNIRDWAARSTPLAPAVASPAPRATAAASSNATATTSRPNSSLQIIPINPTTPSASPAVPIQNVANEVVVQTSASSTASSTIASAPHAVVPNPQDPTSYVIVYLDP